MKYYSEILDNLFDTEQELIDAEFKHSESVSEQEHLKKDIREAYLNITEAEEKVNQAETQVKELQAQYDEEIEAINLKYNLLVKDIMDPANKCLKDARFKREELLKEYNKKFGPYIEIFNDEEAAKMRKSITSGSFFDEFLKELGIY